MYMCMCACVLVYVILFFWFCCCEIFFFLNLRIASKEKLLPPSQVLPHLLPFHLFTLSMLIRPWFTGKRLLSISNLKVQKHSLCVVRVFVECVHPRLCKTSQRHTWLSGQAPPEILDLCRDSLCPAFLFFCTLKRGRSGAFLQPLLP